MIWLADMTPHVLQGRYLCFCIWCNLQKEFQSKLDEDLLNNRVIYGYEKSCEEKTWGWHPEASKQAVKIDPKLIQEWLSKRSRWRSLPLQQLQYRCCFHGVTCQKRNISNPRSWKTKENGWKRLVEFPSSPNHGCH